MLVEILEIVVSLSVSAFIGFYLLYFSVCVRYKSGSRTDYGRDVGEFSTTGLPTISMIIPVYNEAQVILQKIENLRTTRYPKDKLEIVFVDGGSEDGTVDLLRSQTSGVTFKIIQQGSRKGFNSAVIAGFAESKGQIICISGAETLYDPEALNIMIRHFKNPSVGAVTGRQKIINLNEGVSPKLEASYRSIYDFLREAESHIDCPFDIKGEICLVRRKICEECISKPDLCRTGTIDTCFSFQGRVSGYKTVYDPNAVYYELAPRSIRDSFKQMIRRAATLIQNMMLYRSMILKKEYGAFGMIIFPAHFFMLIISPILFLEILIGFAAIIMLNPSEYYFVALGVAVLLGAVVSRRIQAFLKTQVALGIALVGLLTGIETQKFERLKSIRPF